MEGDPRLELVDLDGDLVHVELRHVQEHVRFAPVPLRQGTVGPGALQRFRPLTARLRLVPRLPGLRLVTRPAGLQLAALALLAAVSREEIRDFLVRRVDVPSIDVHARALFENWGIT